MVRNFSPRAMIGWRALLCTVSHLSSVTDCFYAAGGGISSRVCFDELSLLQSESGTSSGRELTADNDTTNNNESVNGRRQLEKLRTSFVKGILHL